MIKLSPSRFKSKILLIYCSVVPHDFPPFHRINFVRELSKYINVIFVDLPSIFRFVPISKLINFYVPLIKTLFRFDYTFVWELFRFRRFHFLILNFYLLFQKYYFNKKIVLYTTSGYFDPIYRYIPYDKSVFDCPDIHEGEFERNKNWINKFDLVFANTKLVFESIRKYNRKVKMMPSGYRNYKIINFTKEKIPNSVLFLGGISQRIDYDFLIKVIENLPNVEFYFIGEVYLNKYYVEKKDKARLKKWMKLLAFSNVHYLGELSENILESILPIFKVGIIPYFSKDSFNFYSNPIKLYDYLSYGIYTISTSLPNVENFTGNFPIYTANSASEFVINIKRVLEKTEKEIFRYENQIMRFLKSESMENKVSRVLEEINLLFKARM